MIVLDTAALIDLEQCKLPDQAKTQLRGEQLAITSLTYAEYWYGLLPNPKAELITRLSQYDVLQTTTQAAQIFAEDKQRLKQHGDIVADFDTFIAAITKAHNAPLLTSDTAFNHVNELQTIHYNNDS